jgi:hypothetical protein
VASQPPQSLEIPLSWVGYDEVPIAYANQFIIQFQPEAGFVLGIGQATGPALIGSPEQMAEQASQVEFVAVRTLARVAFTEQKLRELIAALQANLANFERARAQLDPRHQDDAGHPPH